MTGKRQEKIFDQLSQYESIKLVSHPSNDSWWNTRHYYKTPAYNDNLHYNHRKMLRGEVVFEYDYKNKEKNKNLVEQIKERLEKHGFEYTEWFSGGKSFHLHTYWKFPQVDNERLLKKCILQKFTEDLPNPDLQLASKNSLIRAEYGKHESTGKYKTLISDKFQIVWNKIPQFIWDRYTDYQSRLVKRRMTENLNNIDKEDNRIQFLLESDNLKKIGDGRERALFILCHVLKSEYDSWQELADFLTSWYKYAHRGRGNLSEQRVRYKVKYHWDRTYRMDTIINELLTDLGVDIDE